MSSLHFEFAALCVRNVTSAKSLETGALLASQLAAISPNRNKEEKSSRRAHGTVEHPKRQPAAIQCPQAQGAVSLFPLQFIPSSIVHSRSYAASCSTHRQSSDSRVTQERWPVSLVRRVTLYRACVLSFFRDIVLSQKWRFFLAWSPRKVGWGRALWPVLSRGNTQRPAGT